jgi:phospholipid-binding lipoprotein MlaA
VNGNGSPAPTLSGVARTFAITVPGGFVLIRFPRDLDRTLSPAVLVAVFVLVLAGCGSVTRSGGSAALVTPATLPAAEIAVATTDAEASAGVEYTATTDETPVPAPVPAPVSAGGDAVNSAQETIVPADPGPGTSRVVTDDAAPTTKAQVAQADSQKPAASDADEDEPDDFDPWERFNEPMFKFNYNVDKYVLKPVATVYNKIMPDPFQVMVSNGFNNIAVVPRFVNNLLQAKWSDAGIEALRFFINTTAGIGGLFDPARDYWQIERPPREDFGQTLGRWGIGPGPYLVLPLLDPTTVRDGIGRGVDSVMNPLTYVVPFIWARFGMTLGEIVNDRSLNLELFQGFEDTMVDLYSAVRHAYLQRRVRQVRE